MKTPLSHRRLLLQTLAVSLLLVCSSALAQASTLAVFPLESQEAFLGVAVAERVAAAVEQASQGAQGAQREVLGPDVALALAPLYPVQGGFLSPLQLLGSGQGTGQTASSRTAAVLLRDALGVDAALGGRIDFVGGQLELTFHLATPRGAQTFSASAPEANPERLAETVLAVLEQRLGLFSTSAGEGRSAALMDVAAIDLDAPYGDYVEGVALLSGGFVAEAQAALERAVRRSESQGEANPRYSELLEVTRAATEGNLTDISNLPLAATLALNTQSLDDAQTLRIFERLAEQGDVPAYETWIGLLRASVDNADDSAAVDAFDAAATYPFGRAARALYAALNDGPRADVMTDIEAISQSESSGALIGATLAAQLLEDADLETRLATQLSRLAPSLPYAFERLSQLAFDADEPLEAAQALSIATQLEPESDLYWTNLGWAYYLLGRLEASEDASLQALELNPDEFIAWYNLGLTRAVTGRLGAAMDAYNEALSRDPEVDDAAIEDLENALDLYPDVADIHFALGALYEAEDRGNAATAQFERYLARLEEEPEGERADAPRFRERAERRLEVLRTPPAPIEIGDDARLSLGPNNLSVESFRPGDRLFPDFELFTPGLELPQEATLTLRLLDAQNAPVDGATYEETFAIPGNAVALQIDDVGFALPTDLAPGAYTLEVALSARRGRRASEALRVEVTGEPSFVRRLISQGVTLRGLASSRALYDERNVSLADETLVQRLLDELRDNAEAARDALPDISTGRFEGLSGDALFNGSSTQDVRDFLSFLLEQQSVQSEGEGDLSVSFVDAYAQWALEGAPTL